MGIGGCRGRRQPSCVRHPLHGCHSPLLHKSACTTVAVAANATCSTRRLEAVKQLGVDRIVQLTFGSGPAACHLLLEFYAQVGLGLGLGLGLGQGADACSWAVVHSVSAMPH